MLSSPDWLCKSESCKTSGFGCDVCFLQALSEDRNSDQRGDGDRSLLSLFDLKQIKISINICFADKIYKMYKTFVAILSIIQICCPNCSSYQGYRDNWVFSFKIYKTFHFLYDLTDLDDEFQASDGSSFIVWRFE